MLSWSRQVLRLTLAAVRIWAKVGREGNTEPWRIRPGAAVPLDWMVMYLMLSSTYAAGHT